MKSFRFLIYLGVLCSLVCYSCNGSKNSDPKPEDLAVLQADAIPEDAIPFHYPNDTLKIILIDAVLNGTDSITVYWDTGASCMAAPTAYQNRLEGKDSVRLKLGRLDLAYKGEIYFSDLYFNSKGENRIIGGHNLFKDQIVQISYDRKYLRVLDSVDGLEGYERIPYKINKIDRRFYIPISVCVQGKVFHIEEVLLDTGFNGAFITSEKFLPGLDLCGATTRYFGYAGEPKITMHGIPADSIRVGGVSVTDMEIYLAPDKKGTINILGNGFFSHFSVVFDFKNQNLYLKPLEK